MDQYGGENHLVLKRKMEHSVKTSENHLIGRIKYFEKWLGLECLLYMPNILQMKTKQRKISILFHKKTEMT